ncbi:ABC transporter permease [Clostridia bacterium]|nr:ABC transporter permease [Clostridia bacterium]
MVENRGASVSRAVITVYFVLVAMLFVIPLWLVISSSFSNDADIRKYGYALIPKAFDLGAYRTLFRMPGKIVQAYKITFFISIVGSAASTIVMGLVAYPLSRTDFAYRRPISVFIIVTMLVSGGLIPSYIMIMQFLKLGNTLWVYILPSLASALYIIIMRTFFQSIPASLVESAKIDGAREMLIFVRIILPLSTPVIATIALFMLLGRWNEWQATLLYIRDERLYTLQFLLQRILREAQFTKTFLSQLPGQMAIAIDKDTPTLSMRYAMTVVAAGPMLIIFPFFQRYFTRGLTIGAVKG